MANEYIQSQLIQSGAKDFSCQEAESAILSMLLVDKNTTQLLGEVSENDFYFEEHKKIFRAMQVVATERKGIDLITVDDAIGKMFPDEQARLLEAMIEASRTSYYIRNVDDYVAIVKELAQRRRSIKAIEEVATQLKDPTVDMSAILEKLREESSRITTSKHSWENMTDVMIATYEYLEKRSKGEEKSIATGIPNVDALVGGFFGGEMTVIGARPSVGKSAFGANIAIEAAKKGFKVGIISREMTDIQFGQRMIAREGFVDGMKLRKADFDEEDWFNIGECLSLLAPLPIAFMFTIKTVEDLRIEVQKKVEKNELDILIVDYLQLMHTAKKFKEDYLRVGYISKALKDMAVDFNIPIIALAQVNRDTDGQMPTLKSLRSSGDIEQDADGVIFLHRPSSENDPYVDPRDKEYFAAYEQSDLTYICIGVAKQRQGTVGKACVLFDSAHMRYYPIDRDS